MTSTATLPPRHRNYEDAAAVLSGTLFVALGVSLFGHTGLITGGTTGIAFLLHYAFGWNFSLMLFAVNLPFYALAWQRMGRAFTLKTFSAVALLAFFVQTLPLVISFQTLNPLFATLMGGLLIGTGMLMLFRHRASLGGLNVLALYLQERFGWRAGTIQMGLDSAIVLCALGVIDWRHVLLSVAGAVVLNLTLTVNHRPGRYMTA